MLKPETFLLSPPTVGYRPTVGLFIESSCNPGTFFSAERLDVPGAWQVPQGGIDADENIEQAAFREMLEEIGTNKGTLVQQALEWVNYDLPSDYNKLQPHLSLFPKGSAMCWVHIKFEGENNDINLSVHHPQEFIQWKWATFQTILNEISDFKKNAYQKAGEILNLI